MVVLSYYAFSNNHPPWRILSSVSPMGMNIIVCVINYDGSNSGFLCRCIVVSLFSSSQIVRAEIFVEDKIRSGSEASMKTINFLYK